MSDEKLVGVLDVQRHFADAPSPDEIRKRNVEAVRTAVFGLTETRRRELALRKAKQSDPTQVGLSAGEVQTISADPFGKLTASGRLVETPFDMLTLAMLPENNTELGPLIDAMAVNVESFGWKLEPRVVVDEGTSIELLSNLTQERTKAENFFAYAYQDGSLEDLRDRLRRDLEATGNCYVEHVENPVTGALDGLHHVPSWTVRLSPPDSEPTLYTELRVVKQAKLTVVPEVEPTKVDDADDLPEADDSDETLEAVQKRVKEEVTYRLEPRIRSKRFRRYVQRIGTKLRWFKELGDPRLISCETGEPVTEQQLAMNDTSGNSIPRYVQVAGQIKVQLGTVGFPVALAANPVRHIWLYSTRSPYGLPRHIGHLFAIFGSRAADEINYTTFKNNNVPSMAITVSNGMLNDASVERLNEFFETAIAGDDNYSKILLLEADPVSDGIRDPGTVKIDIRPLTREQHTDALFVEYSKNNDDRVRRAWRFSPIFVGMLTGISGKEIESGRRLADEQIFTPERARMDRYFTRDVLPRLGIVWSTFKSLSPNVTENTELVKLLVSAEKSGGITPRISRRIMSLVTNMDLGEIDPGKLDPDKPFSQSLAELMMDKSATQDGSGPTSQGRIGVQTPSVPRERTDRADSVDKLATMLRDEVGRRFGGFIPAAFDDNLDDESKD